MRKNGGEKKITSRILSKYCEKHKLRDPGSSMKPSRLLKTTDKETTLKVARQKQVIRKRYDTNESSLVITNNWSQKIMESYLQSAERILYPVQIFFCKIESKMYTLSEKWKHRILAKTC